ncbi:MAG: tetratricopeptide repeat protein [Porticoccaceae bacterium]
MAVYIAAGSPAIAQTVPTEVTESDPISDYLDAIETAEAELSAYSSELSDLYFGLGKSHFSKREYERARRAYQRGMQIERVNYGLNSLSQTPYLLSIAEAESFLGNWDESQDALENLYQINSQAYGENDPKMLPVLDELLDWYMDTYSERTHSGGYQNLVISERLSNRMASILKKSVPLEDPDAADRYRKISHLHYFIANHIKQYGLPSESGLSINTGSTTRSQESTSQQHYRRGKAALEKVVESLEKQEDSSDLQKALAMAELGDWYLVFGQRMSASKAYKLAYESLQESAESQQLTETLFGKPSIIEFTALGASKKSPGQELKVSMVVSKAGVPGKVEILNPPENISKTEVRAILKDIRSKRFRPRLVDGETAESSIVFPYASKKTQGS